MGITHRIFSSLFPTLASLLTRKMILCYLFLYGAAVFFSSGFYHLDEHFQILEFAGWKLGIPSELPWEFSAQIRPTFQPSLVYVFYQMAEWFYGDQNVNPFHLATFLRLFTVIFYTLAMCFFLEALLKSLPLRSRGYVIWLSIIMWFFPYLAVRFSSENFSRIFFLLSLSLPLWWENRKETPTSTDGWIWFMAGTASGLAIFSRFQSGFMVVGLVAWMVLIKKPLYKNISFFILGVILISLGNIGLDTWFYGERVFTPWNYFNANLLKDRASDFGVSPWYGYFVKGIQRHEYNPFFFLNIFSPILFFILYPRHVLTWVTLPFLLVHFAIDHKEIRFLFPLVSFLPFFIVWVLEKFLDKWKGWWSGSFKHRIIQLFLITNSVWLGIATVVPAEHAVDYFYKYLYDRGLLHRNDPSPVIFSLGNNSYRSVGFVDVTELKWYAGETLIIYDLTNTDHLLREWEKWSKGDPRKSNETVLWVSPSPLLIPSVVSNQAIEETLSPEWAGDYPILFPQWEYSFPFKEIHHYPWLYRIWTRNTPMLVFHIYTWKP